MLRTSRYNFHVPVEGDSLLYNASSGSVLRLGGGDGATLATQLSGPPTDVAHDDGADAGLIASLLDGGFLVPDGTDELDVIRERYRRARTASSLVVMITTTMDCNLGCYYCYEERSDHQLTAADVPDLVADVRRRLERSGAPGLHVSWYGGEPLLNIDFLEEASAALQTMCDERGTPYAASVITNGTLWPDDVGGFLQRHRIREIQVSFDGYGAEHSRRRHYRKGHRAALAETPFDRAVAVVDAALDHCTVHVRCNLSATTVGSFVELMAFARERGWFERRYPAIVQPARLAAFSEHSDFMRDRAMSHDDVEAARAALQDAAGPTAAFERPEAPTGFPEPRTWVCAALAPDSVVVGADRRMYRCGLQVGETHRAVGDLPKRRHIPVVAAEADDDTAFWADFDPTEQPTCRRCSFLPICWGGCPKHHLEGDRRALDEQGAFWRENLARLVATGVGETLVDPGPIGSDGQFRDG